MLFPESFYYQDGKIAAEINGANYLMQRVNFGNGLSVQAEIKKKQLVLADWRLFYLWYEQDDLKNYLDKVQRLIDEGFIVWCPVENEFIALETAYDLCVHLVSFKPTSLPIQEILPQDALCLNYFVMGQLFTDLNANQYEYTSKKVLKLSDLNKLRKISETHYQCIVDELIQQLHSSLNVVIDITSANKIADDLITVFCSNATQGLYLMHGWLPKIFEPIKVKALNGSFLKVNALKVLLNRSDELETFILDRRYNYQHLFEDVRLTKLKQLILSNCTFYLKALRTFLKQAKNLEVLVVMGCGTNLAGLFKNLEFPKLKKIDLSNTSFDPNELNSFLRQNKKIEKILLSGCSVNLGRLFKKISVNNLQKLELQAGKAKPQKNLRADTKLFISANHFSTENVPLDSHPLHNYMQVIGLPYNLNGTCLGLCLASAEAFANGPENYKQFRLYIDEICKTDLKNIAFINVSIQTQAFLEKIVLYQTPTNFPEYFKPEDRSNLAQFNLRLTASIAQSQLTELRGGLIYYCFQNIYTNEDLGKYLLSYANWLDAEKDMRCPLILDNNLHGVMLAYDSHLKKWFFEDYASQTIFDKDNIVEISKAIKASHSKNDPELIAAKSVILIHTTIICIKNTRNFRGKFCQPWFDDPGYKFIHSDNYKKRKEKIMRSEEKALKEITKRLDQYFIFQTIKYPRRTVSTFNLKKQSSKR